MKNILYIFISLYSLSFFGQNELTSKIKDTTTTWQLLKYDIGVTAKSIGYVYTRPLHWEKNDFKKLTTIGISVFALSIADEEANRFFTKHSDNYPKFANEFGFWLGKPQAFFLINTGLYGFGLFTNNEAVRKTSILIISSAITAGMLQSISKTAFGRARPGSGLGHDEFNPFSSDAMYHSFPSGHTVLAITMAHSIAKQFDNTWVKIGIYSLGSITPITRLVGGAHWLTDVVVGAVLSIVVVDSIDSFLFKTKAYDYEKKNKISWNFTFSGNQLGFIGTF